MLKSDCTRSWPTFEASESLCIKELSPREAAIPLLSADFMTTGHGPVNVDPNGIGPGFSSSWKLVTHLALPLTHPTQGCITCNRVNRRSRCCMTEARLTQNTLPGSIRPQGLESNSIPSRIRSPEQLTTRKSFSPFRSSGP